MAKEQQGKKGLGAPELIGSAVVGTAVAGVGKTLAVGQNIAKTDIAQAFVQARNAAVEKGDLLNGDVLQKAQELQSKIADANWLKENASLNMGQIAGIGLAVLAAGGLTAAGINALRNRGTNQIPSQQEPYNPAKDNARVQEILASRQGRDPMSQTEMLSQRRQAQGTGMTPPGP